MNGTLPLGNLHTWEADEVGTETEASTVKLINFITYFYHNKNELFNYT